MWHRAVQTRFSKGVPLAEEEMRVSWGVMSSGALSGFDAFGALYVLRSGSGGVSVSVMAIAVVVVINVHL